MIIIKKLINSGFSLVEIMVAVAMVGGLSLVVMQVLKTTNKGQIDVQNHAEYSSIRDEVNFLISNDSSCKASLSGFTFRGSSIKNTPKNGVELWSADQAGVRSTRKFFADASFGKLVIDNITFSMPDYTAGVDWPEGSSQSFTAELSVNGKKNNMGNTRSFATITRSINISFDTDSSGVSTIKNCRSMGASSSGGGSHFTIWGNSICPSGLETVKSGKSFTSAISGSGNPGTDIVCSSGTGVRNVFVINAARTGYTWEPPLECAVCSTEGAKFCFTNYGSNSCPSGFSAAYTGKMFQAAWSKAGTSGTFICKEGVSYGGIYVVNSSLSNYEWIDGESCAECCRD